MLTIRVSTSSMGPRLGLGFRVSSKVMLGICLLLGLVY